MTFADAIAVERGAIIANADEILAADRKVYLAAVEALDVATSHLVTSRSQRAWAEDPTARGGDFTNVEPMRNVLVRESRADGFDASVAVKALARLRRGPADRRAA